MKSRRKGPENNNWKGGRTIEPRGYVLLRIPDHHRSDVRGYVYEHIVVAEQKIGRNLRKGEIVHHLNENKSDNRPENLVIVQSAAEHRVYHRKPGSKRKMPHEENTTVTCACGCNLHLEKYDSHNRPRKYIYKHYANVQRGRPKGKGPDRAERLTHDDE